MEKNLDRENEKIPEKLEQVNQILLEKGYGLMPMTKKVVKKRKNKVKFYEIIREKFTNKFGKRDSKIRNKKRYNRIRKMCSRNPNKHIIFKFE